MGLNFYIATNSCTFKCATYSDKLKNITIFFAFVVDFCNSEQTKVGFSKLPLLVVLSNIHITNSCAVEVQAQSLSLYNFCETTLFLVFTIINVLTFV